MPTGRLGGEPALNAAWVFRNGGSEEEALKMVTLNAAEMLGGALPANKVTSVVSHMKRLQDDLGQFQDSEVQLHLIRDLLDDQSLGEPSNHALAAGELTMQDLVERQEEARGDLVKALREFARS